ncbi:hypothetical protein UFOVP115_118 [uncultured Caudovirales phage]|uniref:Uncharacterized protein n=1 Tax=uncultured Caudovirales phage TaxID=2100421 RepID=A0A6J5LDM4_9CAUD|nr:hypothetical protein UFOVP115_118 [uncultured Caudovirales phage]
MPNIKVDIRRKGPLARRFGAITSTDVYENLGLPAGRSREFQDAFTRASGAISGVPTHMKEQGRWKP